LIDKKIAIFITTKNRLEALRFTLKQCEAFIYDAGVEFLVCDDGSIDGTFEFVKTKYPQIKLYRNEQSQGYLFSRNFLLNCVKAPIAICLDDDAHFLSTDVEQHIISHFKVHTQCGLIAFRIFWGANPPQSIQTNELPERVKGFVGCGHAWLMEAWRAIPDYPEWFEFYGEEEFAAYHLFKKNLEVHYLPEVLVHHRVELKSRKKQPDYTRRLRRSLRTGWYLYLLFLPKKVIPRKMMYSIYMQLRLKVFKGEFRALKALLLAKFDLFFNSRLIFKNRNRFNIKEWDEFTKLESTKIYWNPETKSNEDQES